MSLLEYHRALVADTATQEAYRRAIHAAVRPGAVVLDVGTGTGLHALFACQAGAARVYAVEPAPIVQVVREVCRANGCQAQVVVVERSIEAAEIPERVDVIVRSFNQLGDILTLLPLARDRFLKPDGVLIPDSLDLFAAPVSSESTYGATVDVWRQQYGFNLEPIRKVASRTSHQCVLRREDLLSDGSRIASVHFRDLQRPTLSGSVKLAVSHPGPLHGVCFWTVRHLHNELAVSNAPGSGVSEALWRQRFVPLRAPHDVHQGDTVSIRVRVEVIDSEEIWAWEIGVENSRAQQMLRESGTTFGSGLTPAALRRFADDFKPHVSRHGEAMKFVLERLDGAHTLEQIEEQLASTFADLFAGKTDASRFIASLVARAT